MTRVRNAQDYWFFGPCPSSAILTKHKRTNILETEYDMRTEKDPVFETLFLLLVFLEYQTMYKVKKILRTNLYPDTCFHLAGNSIRVETSEQTAVVILEFVRNIMI
jgi:hypothetical protein